MPSQSMYFCISTPSRLSSRLPRSRAMGGIEPPGDVNMDVSLDGCPVPFGRGRRTIEQRPPPYHTQEQAGCLVK